MELVAVVDWTLMFWEAENHDVKILNDPWPNSAIGWCDLTSYCAHYLRHDADEVNL